MKFSLLLYFQFMAGCLVLPVRLQAPSGAGETHAWIRVNQLGYLPEAVKVAVWVTQEKARVRRFELRDAATHKVVWRGKAGPAYGAYAAFSGGSRLDFSSFQKPGTYYLRAAKTTSPSFRIGSGVYDGTADYALHYMRQQRCGYNPFLQDSCHTRDGFIVFHPTRDSTFIDVTGGWHDASDYLQYVTTSANATFQLLFAYAQNPGAFADAYDHRGLPGANGIPDILDEAKWGLDWLVKMNPEAGEMYNQIADDRDHAGYRLPNHDLVDYGKGKGQGRPVYFCTGQPQGAKKYRNRSTGIASTAGKYASAFALGAQVLAGHYPDFAQLLQAKAREAYAHGVANPGVSQTAPGGAPYFYEEDNWVDDLELAAVQLATLTGQEQYLREAAAYGRQEPVTPWMGADTARHYQWYPFLNLGHYYLARSGSEKARQEFTGYLREGLERVSRRGEGNPFRMGVPFIWCSNNLVAALVTQASLYRELTGDEAYLQLEASLRDWLFGCNPWGTSMIIGLPEGGDYPQYPHSSFSKLHGYKLEGGLVDGPVYGSIFGSLIGLTLEQEDAYKDFQSRLVVYHDDFGDYSTNEPTMDGTASLTYFLSTLQKQGQREREKAKAAAGGAGPGKR